MRPPRQALPVADSHDARRDLLLAHRGLHGYGAKAMKKKRRRAATASQVACPFCGEAEEMFVDAGGGARQTYTEDCAVCCRPRVVHVEPGEEPGEVRIWLERGE
jgi:hypothetical protein